MAFAAPNPALPGNPARSPSSPSATWATPADAAPTFPPPTVPTRCASPSPPTAPNRSRLLRSGTRPPSLGPRSAGILPGAGRVHRESVRRRCHPRTGARLLAKLPAADFGSFRPLIGIRKKKDGRQTGTRIDLGVFRVGAPQRRQRPRQRARRQGDAPGGSGGRHGGHAPRPQARSHRFRGQPAFPPSRCIFPS